MIFPTRPSTIAIDGPAASGKSTVGFAVAQQLGYLFFDSGVVYRAITWLARARNIKLSDEASIVHLAQTTRIDVLPPGEAADGRLATVCVNGHDVTWDLRDPAVNAGVSVVAAYADLRLALIGQQQRIGRAGQVVMVGRDIGTVILPDADLKIYLDASLEARAQRRYAEDAKRGLAVTLDAVRDNLRQRDWTDRGRSTAPLRQAVDAHVIDSTALSIDEVIARVMALVNAWSSTHAASMTQERVE